MYIVAAVIYWTRRVGERQAKERKSTSKSERMRRATVKIVDEQRVSTSTSEGYGSRQATGKDRRGLNAMNDDDLVKEWQEFN